MNFIFQAAYRPNSRIRQDYHKWVIEKHRKIEKLNEITRLLAKKA